MKKLSLIFFITWTVLVVLILSFGVKPYRKIVAFFSERIYSEKNTIDDIQLARTEFSLGYEYYLDYTMTPSNYHDMGIVMESLNPEVFEINNRRIICNLDHDASGKVLITSTVDTKFRKEVTVNFHKVYATNFTMSCYNVAYSNKDVYIGVPFVMKYTLSAPMAITEPEDVEIIYDTEHLTLLSQNGSQYQFEPKVEGYGVGDTFEPVDTFITLKYYGEVKKTINLKINTYMASNSFDYGVFKASSHSSRDTLKTSNSYYLELYSNDTLIYGNFEIESLNPEIARVDSQNHVIPQKPGNAVIRVKIGDSTQDINIKVIYNIIKPTVGFKDELEDGVLKVMDDQVNWFSFTFNNEESYDYFKGPTSNEYFYISYEKIPDELRIRVILSLKKEGKTTLEFSVGDENTKYEIPINVEGVISKVSKVSITQRVGRFIGKIAGHASFFVLEAMLAFLFLYYYHFKKKLKFLNIIIYVLIGFALGCLTEFIQLFLPDRYGTMKDVGIDMLGYTFGFVVSTIFYGLIRLINRIIEKKRQEHNESSPENDDEISTEE